MSNDLLPPLPEPHLDVMRPGTKWYTADQMRAYALAAMAQPAVSGKPFRPDWSLLEATQASLREHMAEIQRLRAALSQPAASGERPTAWWYMGIRADEAEHGPHLVWSPAYMDATSARKGVKATPLYTAPQPAPARVPLTDEQINQITAAQWGAGLGAPYAAYRAYARAIEATHGITTKEAP